MKINLIAIGKKMPGWVNAGFDEYVQRLPKEFHLNLIEVAAKKRTPACNTEQLLAQEGERILNKIPKNNRIIALDRLGETLNTKELAMQFNDYYQHSQDVSLLIGGPEGLSQTCLQKSDKIWSISALTLPHPLVRVIIAEQIYRIWSILSQHPYHK